MFSSQTYLGVMLMDTGAFQSLAQVADVNLPISIFIQFFEELSQPLFVLEGQLVQVMGPGREVDFVLIVLGWHFSAVATLDTLARRRISWLFRFI